MRGLYVLAVFTAFMLTGCKSSKKAVLSVPSPSQEQWGQQRPVRTLRTAEPCVELAESEGDRMRAYGTATSYVEKTALSEAERDARNRLARRIKVAVEGAAQDYAQNANQNMKNSAQTLGEEVMTQYVNEEIENARILKTTIYDVADGSIQVYVCLEMRTDKSALQKRIDHTLDREGIIQIQYDRERFLKKMAEGLENYKNNR